MNPVEEILNKYSPSPRTEPLTTSIEAIEEAIGFVLPEDYKKYLLNFKGFEHEIGEEYIHLWDINELIENNEDYLITNNFPFTIGIGDDRGGEFIALERLENKEFRVVLSPFLDTDPQFHVEIGESFSDFLIRLENGKKWID
ncbi:MAG TPA: SMI1/KNR4 family protein [Bacteroidia bacterium]|jgi:hypothetical protein|nr:SMI1/KNR4 family protein [Bacteroidia bacterium]